MPVNDRDARTTDSSAGGTRSQNELASAADAQAVRDREPD